jgi:hypothetical protein
VLATEERHQKRENELLQAQARANFTAQERALFIDRLILRQPGVPESMLEEGLRLISEGKRNSSAPAPNPPKK